MRNKHDIEDLAFEALHSAKKIREVVNMWMNSLSTDESDSREEILISLLLDLANTQVSRKRRLSTVWQILKFLRE
ncbi:hypothetical protein [Escherichia coli]|uniref:hypothetical protein n=1 Tax=Escherichia coli TaxID=562 RepID=UPI0023B0196C|nr:hypothetical protein [Escherichia coli]MDE8141657.1 hypothetical protein [Escherichia coli]